MAEWRYAATDLLTGQMLANDLPLQVQSFSANLNGTGTLSGSLNLNEVYEVNAPYVTALAPRRSMLWAIADGWPAWCGIVWDWPDMSRSQGTLSISAQTPDSLWGHRLVTDTIEYAAVDLFTAFTDLCRYGMTKQSPYISTAVSPAAARQPGYLQAAAAQGKMARLVLPSGAAAGATWTASYVYSDLTQISGAWSDMCASGNLEYFFEPGLDESGDLAVYLRLGYTALGRPLADSGLVLSYPGNVLDYGWQVTGSQSSNMIWGTAPPNGSAAQWMSVWPHGADTADLAVYPLLESTVAWQGSVVTAQAQVDAFAGGQAAMLTAGMTTPAVTVGGGAAPALRDIRPGDSALLALTSPLHPARPDGSPGVQTQVRITGITVTPSGPGQSESYQLTTSAVVAP